MPKSEKQRIHLEKLNGLPKSAEEISSLIATSVPTRFHKGMTPWNKGTKVMVTLNCQFCEAEFQLPQAQLKRQERGAGRYCSKSCFYDAKKKYSLREKIRPLYESGKTYKEIGAILNLNPFTIGSQVYRMKIADRYGNGINSPGSKKRVRHLLKDYHGIESCELCGYGRTTDVAHVVEVKNGGGHFIDNCLLLCPNCHHLFDHKLLNSIEIEKLKGIARLNGNLARRFAYAE